MTKALTVRGRTTWAVAVIALGVLGAWAPAASATKLIVRSGSAVLPANSPFRLVSTNSEAGEEKCALVVLSGTLLTNSKGTDKAEITSGTFSGWTATMIGAVSTVPAGFPWKVKLHFTGAYKFKGTPRLEWTDTFGPAPGTCSYKAANAVNTGTFTVTTLSRADGAARAHRRQLVDRADEPTAMRAGVLNGTFEAFSGDSR